jgi:hypothetical protein
MIFVVKLTYFKILNNCNQNDISAQHIFVLNYISTNLQTYVWWLYKKIVNISLSKSPQNKIEHMNSYNDALTWKATQ